MVRARATLATPNRITTPIIPRVSEAERGATVGAPAKRRRPSVDVVVPFAGSRSELWAVCERMAALRLGPEDSLLVVDNTPRRGADAGDAAGVTVVPAAGRRTPGFARNQGAARGTAEWIVFIDADAVPERELLDRYFDPPPGARTALIGGGVLDEPVPQSGPPVARYTYLRQTMSPERTFSFGDWAYPKSANIAVRRSAFDSIAGFREDIRAAEDADLAYRLKAAGWAVERREPASIEHLNRRTLRGLIKQQALWGAGGAWLERAYPGAMPRDRGPGFRLPHRGERGGGRALGGRDAIIYALLRPVEALAWELGRLLPNRRR
jgi:mycofactocin glycosyltransferase